MVVVTRTSIADDTGADPWEGDSWESRLSCTYSSEAPWLDAVHNQAHEHYRSVPLPELDDNFHQIDPAEYDRARQAFLRSAGHKSVEAAGARIVVTRKSDLRCFCLYSAAFTEVDYNGRGPEAYDPSQAILLFECMNLPVTGTLWTRRYAWPPGEPGDGPPSTWTWAQACPPHVDISYRYSTGELRPNLFEATPSVDEVTLPAMLEYLELFSPLAEAPQYRQSSRLQAKKAGGSSSASSQ